MTLTSLSADLRELRKLKLSAEKAKRAYDEANLAFKHAELLVFQRMEAEDCQSQKVGNVNYVRASTVFAQVQDETEFLAWAEQNNPELLAPKPRKKLINELVREALDNSIPLPPGVGFYTNEYVAQRAPGEATKEDS